jgi:hypothetical protein
MLDLDWRRRKRVTPCVMCGDDAVVLPATKDDAVVLGATARRVFCSQRCARNWALANVEKHTHWCTRGGEMTRSDGALFYGHWDREGRASCAHCNAGQKKKRR